MDERSSTSSRCHERGLLDLTPYAPCYRPGFFVAMGSSRVFLEPRCPLSILRAFGPHAQTCIRLLLVFTASPAPSFGMTCVYLLGQAGFWPWCCQDHATTTNSIAATRTTRSPTTATAAPTHWHGSCCPGSHAPDASRKKEWPLVLLWEGKPFCLAG